MLGLHQIQISNFSELSELLTDSLIDQFAVQVLVATNVLMLIEEIRSKRSTRFWIGGLILIAGETLCLVPGKSDKNGLNFQFNIKLPFYVRLNCLC